MPEGRRRPTSHRHGMSAGGSARGCPCAPTPCAAGSLLAPPPRAVLGAHQQCPDPSLSATSSPVGGAQGGSERCHQPSVPIPCAATQGKPRSAAAASPPHLPTCCLVPRAGSPLPNAHPQGAWYWPQAPSCPQSGLPALSCTLSGVSTHVCTAAGGSQSPA